MAEIALVVADEFDKRRNWKDGDHGLGQERKCSTSPSTVSALGRRTQDDASASVLRIGPREVKLARRCLEPKSSVGMATSVGQFPT